MGDIEGVMIGNNTCMARFFKKRILKVCKKMYSQKAFVHWFENEGMEQGEFDDAIQDLECLKDDYLSMC